MQQTLLLETDMDLILSFYWPFLIILYEPGCFIIISFALHQFIYSLIFLLLSEFYYFT